MLAGARLPSVPDVKPVKASPPSAPAPSRVRPWLAWQAFRSSEGGGLESDTALIEAARHYDAEY